MQKVGQSATPVKCAKSFDLTTNDDTKEVTTNRAKTSSAQGGVAKTLAHIVVEQQICGTMAALGQQMAYINYKRT